MTAEWVYLIGLIITVLIALTMAAWTGRSDAWMTWLPVAIAWPVVVLILAVIGLGLGYMAFIRWLKSHIVRPPDPYLVTAQTEVEQIAPGE